MPDVITIVALAISIISIWISVKSYTESSTSTTVRSQYDHFANLTQMQIEYSQFSHLLATPECYGDLLAQIKASLRGLSKEDKIKYLLQERAFADYIFNEFEQSFYQITRARPFFDKRSQKFYEEVLDYFALRLLRNPRLLYYWSQLCSNYESSTVAFYNKKVLSNSLLPITIDPDPLGPVTLSESSVEYFL